MRLTMRSVDALSPAEKPINIWDSSLPGFGVRVNPSGKKVWQVRIRIRGSGSQRTITIARVSDMPLEEAKDRARRAFINARDGIDPRADERRMAGPAMADLLDRYMSEWVLPRRKEATIRAYESKIRTVLKPRLGAVKVAEFSEEHVLKLQATYGREHRVGCNRCLAILSKALNLAEVWRYRPKGSNPCKGIERFREQPRDRMLDSGQLERLWQELAAVDQERWKLWSVTWLIRMLILTGARDGELMRARWEDIDWDHQLLILHDSKTGPGELHLSDFAIEILREIPREQGSPWIFPGQSRGRPISSPWAAWRRICARCGLAGFWLHDLRHTYASAADRMGLSPKEIQGLLRHKTMVTTLRYINIVQREKASASRRVGDGFADRLK